MYVHVSVCVEWYKSKGWFLIFKCTLMRAITDVDLVTVMYDPLIIGLSPFTLSYTSMQLKVRQSQSWSGESEAFYEWYRHLT